MISKNYKKLLISKVDELSKDKVFWEKFKYDKYGNKITKPEDGKLGSTNIRSVATVCENADCFEEIKLYIGYKIAKGNGWNERIKVKDKDIIFGNAVIKHMEEIYEECKEDDDKALEMIGLYFGYLFWRKAEIEKGEYFERIKQQEQMKQEKGNNK